MWPVGYPTAAYAEDQLVARTKPNPLKQTLNQRSKYCSEFILNSTESYQTCGIDQDRENVAQDTVWAVQLLLLPALFGIDMDNTRMFHFQQDYLGCVDDEANIVKKCEARRQVTFKNIYPRLSR